MSAVEMVAEKVKHLDEERARQLLRWFDNGGPSKPALGERLGAEAMLGFARRLRTKPRTTIEWMAELRQGETQ